MTQIQMEYFIKTCEFGNIAQAADALFVSRSAVSRAISDLEKEFQAELLTRSKNGVTPTNAGQIVLEMAKNVSSSYQGVVRRIRELEDWRLFHQVRVGITPTNNLQVYQNYLRQYALDSPGVKLVLTEECASRCLELLSLGQVDVTFILSRIWIFFRFCRSTATESSSGSGRTPHWQRSPIWRSTIFWTVRWAT